MAAIDFEITKQSIRFVGELSRRTVTNTFEKKTSRLLSQSEHVFDFASVTKVDTAGLAWLLLMIERAGQKNISLSCINIPNELTKLAKLSAVDSFLPVK